MVTFNGMQDSTFVFDIENYQFPDAIDDLDANFLVATGHVTTDIGSWKWRDACLMSDDLPRLAEWLRALRGPWWYRRYFFTEPGVYFVAKRHKGLLTVTIRFSGRMMPFWQRGTEKNRHSYLLVCPETLNDFDALADDVDALAKRWGVRPDLRPLWMKIPTMRDGFTYDD